MEIGNGVSLEELWFYLKVGIWNLEFGIWNLEFGIWSH
jgi:hypothetical protein